MANEIRALHQCFESWFRGDDETALDRIDRSLAPGFTLVAPNGDAVGRSDVMAGLESARGARPIGVTVGTIDVSWRFGNAAVVTYEERHAHDQYETVRISTALLIVDAAAPGGFSWHHVHETWRTPPPRQGSG